MAVDTIQAPPVPRAILEDRWECAIYERSIGNDWSKVMTRLDRAIIELFELVSRRDYTGEVAATPERPEFNGSGDVQSAVHDAVRRTMLDEIERLGIAAPVSRS